MSIQGNIAIENYINELQKFIGDYESLEAFVEFLKQKLEEDLKAAKDGWL